jgi:RNA polymerase sigma factor (sigma-70 family)
MSTRTHAPDGAESAPPERHDPVRVLWRRWVAQRDPADRERLILHYAPLVKYVAGRLSVGVTGAVELGDLISYGIFGLIDAIERYDPERGSQFDSYAIRRIKGAIMDEPRVVDWVPRAVREHTRAVQAALAELEAQLRRTPTDHELAAHMGITMTRLRELLDQISLTSLVALDALFVDDDGGITRWPRPSMIPTPSTSNGRWSTGSCVQLWLPRPPSCRSATAPSSCCTTWRDDARAHRPDPAGHGVADVAAAHEGGARAAGQARGRHAQPVTIHSATMASACTPGGDR